MCVARIRDTCGQKFTSFGVGHTSASSLVGTRVALALDERLFSRPMPLQQPRRCDFVNVHRQPELDWLPSLSIDSYRRQQWVWDKGEDVSLP